MSANKFQNDVIKALSRIETTLPNLATKTCLETVKGDIKVNDEKIKVNRKLIMFCLVTLLPLVIGIGYKIYKGS